MTLRVLGRRSSNNVQKILWFLEEIGIPFSQEDYGGRFGKTSDADYLALNLHGTVPTLVDGSFSLWESNAILRYLAVKYQATQYTESLQQRADVDKWMDWQLGTLSPAFRPIYIQIVRHGKSIQEVAEECVEARALFKILDQVVASQGYIASDTLTLADFAIGPMIYRWVKLGLNESNTKNLRNLLHRFELRPAFVKHVMLPLE